MASDDEVIRRRLMVDGDGGGDERRLTALLKLYMKWCNSPDAEHSTHQRMLSFLTQSECSITKSSLVYEMNKKQMDKYTKLEEEIDRNVELANQEIEKSKKELVEAKLVRKNRQQYDIMGEVVLQHPDRINTEKKITEYQCELEEMKSQESSLVDKLNRRKKHCHALLTSIHHLQSILDEETQLEETDDKMDTFDESV